VQTIVSGLIAVKWGRIEKKRRRREAAGEEAGGDGE
jgi:hypothetical protein